ncbi:MAG: hypothetical protein ACJAZH_000642 [Roseivirga sp.]|jgi:hypothetical protein
MGFFRNLQDQAVMASKSLIAKSYCATGTFINYLDKRIKLFLNSVLR